MPKIPSSLLQTSVFCTEKTLLYLKTLSMKLPFLLENSHLELQQCLLIVQITAYADI